MSHSPTDRSTASAGLRAWRTLFAAGVFLLASTSARAVDLAPLLNAPGTTVSLSPGTNYTIAEYALNSNKTLLCNGATIQSTGGPIRASAAGVTFIVDHCVMQGTGWALLGALNGSTLVVRNNTSLTGNGANSGIYVASSTLDLTGGTLTGLLWGVNMQNATAALHGANISNTTYGVQNVAGTITVDGQSQLHNLNAGNPGIGVSVIASASFPTRRAVAIIRNSTFTGFVNAVDVQPTAAQGLLAGTVEIIGSTFNTPFVSALAAVDAVDVRFVTSLVNGALADGIYLQNSTGVIERSVILGSLNTGVTFWGCPNGATLRNNLIRGSAHQGVAVVSDPPSGQPSRNIRILDNTFADNVLPDVLVQEESEAILHGNIFRNSAVSSVYLDTAGDADMVGDFTFQSFAGHEVKDGSTLTSSLSLVARQRDVGALVYLGGQASFGHCAFQANGTETGDYSVFVNSGGLLSMQQCVLDPVGNPALYNNAGNTAVATNNYWAHPTGPQLLGGGGGSGSVLGWNTANGSMVSYQPYLTAEPVVTRINETFAQSANSTTNWPTGIGISLSLTGASGIPSIGNGLAAVLRVANAATLTAPAPPSGTFADGVMSVWAHHDLLSRSANGVLRIAAGGTGPATRLHRIRPDGCWSPVASTRDSGTGELIYNPVYPGQTNGTFAIGNPPALEETRARELITSYYQDILARGPETGAVDSWYGGYFAPSVRTGVDVRIVPQLMARTFFASPEYVARNRTDEQFLRDAYQVFLRRAPTQGEIDGWLSGADSWNRTQAVVLFTESAEFAAYLSGLFPCLDGGLLANFVAGMYVALVEKLVDPGGLSYFADALDAAYATAGTGGARLQTLNMVDLLIASADYQAGPPSNDTQVERLYRAFLGRSPNNGEVGYWSGAFDAGTATPQTLIDALAVSPEFIPRVRAAFGSR